MADLKLVNIHKRFGKTEVLRDIELTIRNGEFVVFVGPSGCGKSTLLRIIAGLERQSEGQVLIGGKDVSGLPPARRGIAMVFQSYALYPHLTVRGNISLGLKQARTPKAVIEERVEMAAKMLALEPLLDRKPGMLSGGQRQRVAIGRAIVRNPDVFLFDEPLSNLDASLRSSVRHEIADLHKDIGNTMVYVTHDQVEAMTLADRIVVLANGVVQQVGSPRELYENPANAFVAGFIGSPKMNLIPARGESPEPVKDKTQAEYLWGMRPEYWQVAEAGESGLQATVRFSEYLGGESFCMLHLDGGQELLIRHPPSTSYQPGDVLQLKATHPGFRFNLDGGERIAQS